MKWALLASNHWAEKTVGMTGRLVATYFSSGWKSVTCWALPGWSPAIVDSMDWTFGSFRRPKSPAVLAPWTRVWSSQLSYMLYGVMPPLPQCMVSWKLPFARSEVQMAGVEVRLGVALMPAAFSSETMIWSSWA